MKQEVFRVIKNIVAYLMFFLLMICCLGMLFNLKNLRPQKTEHYVSAVSRQEKQLYVEIESFDTDKVVYVKDATLPVGARYVSAQAEPGLRERVILVTYEENEVVDRREISGRVIERAKPKIVHIGTMSDAQAEE